MQNSIKTLRTTSSNEDFQQLVQLLDADLKIRDGEEHAFFAQYNQTTSINEVVVIYFNARAVACGAFKPFNKTTAEIKRMYVHPDFRRKGLAQTTLQKLEEWAAELGYASCILETGIRQPEAIALYKGQGYVTIPNYGQYENIESSVCMLKHIQA